ncbi:MAG: hypothetical protein K6F87_03505 [Lachnospiraceae bacterium]|nr:hypothetical protein [Lachnospiraceae bacterium]
MSFYQVDSNRLRGKKDELAGLNQRFGQEKEVLCRRETLLRSMWEGEANENFHSLFIRNATQMDSFYELVNRYIEVIGNVAQRYDIAEQNNIGRSV